jgi:electron transport complex protein RnfA
MAEYFAVLIGLALANQFLLGRSPASGPLAATHGRKALAVHTAITGVLAASAGACHLLDRWLLVPVGLAPWRVVAVVLIIGVMAALAQAAMRRARALPALAREPARSLITVNSVALGLAQSAMASAPSPGAAVGYGALTGVAFAIIMLKLTGLAGRLEAADLPAPFRGAAIGLVTAAILSLALAGFSGLGRG